jgi:adenosylcobinamide-GDP ribazoletransferase
MAFEFFTIIPLKSNFDENGLKQMLLFSPITTLLTSTISLFFYKLLLLDLEQNLSAFIAASIYLILSGFLHFDGLADCIDAIAAKHSNKDAYLILKDPHIGVIGVAYIVIFLLFKLFLVMTLLQKGEFLLFILIAAFSKLSIFLPLIYSNIHKKSYLANRLKSSITKKEAFLFLLVLYIFTLFVFPRFFYVIPFILVFSLLISKFFQKKLGFVNGDVLGAVIEISEIFTLFLALICI